MNDRNDIGRSMSSCGSNDLLIVTKFSLCFNELFQSTGDGAFRYPNFLSKPLRHLSPKRYERPKTSGSGFSWSRDARNDAI